MYDEEFVRKSFLDEINVLSHRADAEGVTAYLNRPRPRPRHRPNERFLKTTLQGIEFSEFEQSSIAPCTILLSVHLNQSIQRQ
jgi:hypothetical protein